MKKLVVSLLILIVSASFCSNNSGEPFEDLKTNEEISLEENLIVSDEDLEFSNHKVTLIELGADKCIPCKAMQPVLHEISQEYKGTIQVVFYDVWKTPKYTKIYGVKLIPTQVFIDENGNELFRHVGFYAKEDILKMLRDKGIL